MSKPSFPITGVWLRNQSQAVEVLVEHEGEWKLVIKYDQDAMQHGLISHIVEVAGLLTAKPDNLTAVPAAIEAPQVSRTTTPRKRPLPVQAKVGKRGYDYACEACNQWEGSSLENGFYRCNGCGYPGK